MGRMGRERDGDEWRQGGRRGEGEEEGEGEGGSDRQQGMRRVIGNETIVPAYHATTKPSMQVSANKSARGFDTEYSDR